MCRLSIIVPFVSPSRLFDDTLASTLRYRPPGTEIVVVHNGSYEDPHELDNEVEFVTASYCDKSNPLADLLDAAVAKIAGEIVVWIRPGVELDEGWEDSVVLAFADPAVASVTPIIVDSKRPSEILSLGVASQRNGNRELHRALKKVSRRVLAKAKPIGPSSWLAAWRTETLEALLPLADGVSDVYLDAEIGLSLQHIGCQTHVSESFCGLVDDDNLILDERSVAHGNSSQRGYEKFLAADNRPGLGRNIFNDLISAPFSPWRIVNAIQRFGANQYHLHDEEYMARLDNVRRSGELAAQEMRNSIRRAA